MTNIQFPLVPSAVMQPDSYRSVKDRYEETELVVRLKSKGQSTNITSINRQEVHREPDSI